MSRGLLPESELQAIEAALPDTSSLAEAICSLSPSFLSVAFGPSSDQPIAAVCLLDALTAANSARYALHECIAHGAYYRRFADPPDEIVATWYERFYADDVTLRLYPAGEHLASAIIFMLEIEPEDIEALCPRPSSLQARLGSYLSEHPGPDRVNAAARSLMGSSAWRAALTHRHKWTHEQPPNVSGLGVVYERRRRWREERGRLVLGIGGGDEPKLSTDELRQTVTAALTDYLAALTTVVEVYHQMIEDLACGQGRPKEDAS